MGRSWNRRDGLTCLLEALNRVEIARESDDDVVGDVLLGYVLRQQDVTATVPSISVQAEQPAPLYVA